MNNRVEIVWDEGCPHVEEARSVVREALASMGLPLRWGEWNVSEAFAPRSACGYGSPTVLVDGADVTGAEPAGASSCRVYTRSDGTTAGAPEVSQVRAALDGERGAVRARAFPWIETERLVIWIPGARDAEAVLAYHVDNRDYHAPWTPLRPDGFETPEFWAAKLDEQRRSFMEDRSACFVAALREQPDVVVGQANFRNFVRGAFQACHLGYDVAEAHEGQGLMRETLAATIGYVFEELRLHRVMANHLPENERSAALLQRLGFVTEGHAKEYLHIAGEWRDHVLNALVNPDWTAP